jgi:uncharacterized membrane protein
VVVYFTSGLFCLQRLYLALNITQHIVFHWEELLSPRPTPNLEDHPLSAVRDCLFNVFLAALQIGDLSSIHNLRKCNAFVTGTHENMAFTVNC